MDIGDIPLSKEIIERFRSEGVKFLYPPQKEALESVFAGKSTVVSVPTASGKTLIAYMAILRAFQLGLKSVYVVPLRALAMEKYEELKKFEDLGLRVALAIGDFDTPSGYLKNYNVIVATSEKMDSILRHTPDYAYELGVTVIDEIHMLGEESRGPTLEMVISKIRSLNEEVQIIGLSATIKNSVELASWLNAEHIYSEFRPVPLRTGVYYDDTLLYDDKETERIMHDTIGIGNLISDRLANGGQILVFVNRRKAAESLATKLQIRVGRTLTGEELHSLNELAKKILTEEYSIYSEKIAKLLVHGVAFHHAGLTNSQRKIVEDAFKNRLVKVIIATPTLAAGINLPSRTVIVRDLARFNGEKMVYLPVMEIKQMLGRAGRPKYDRFGEGILYAKSENKAERFMEDYIQGEVEDIHSQLSNERALRVHLLALIASDLANTRNDIVGFFKNTYYGHSLPMDALEKKIDYVIDFLVENGFIEELNFIRATSLGHRVAEVYIDPESALLFEKCYSHEYDEFCVLHTLSASPDMRIVYARRSEMDRLFTVLGEHEVSIDEFDVSQERFFGALKTTLIIQDWINENTQNDIVTRYDIGPGDLHAVVEMADWLLYAFGEIGKVLHYQNYRKVEVLRSRVKYGVLDELLPIIGLRGVGRVRARRLYDYGYTGPDKLKTATVKQLTRIPGIGERLAREIIKQV